MSTARRKPTLSAAQIMADLDSLNNCEPPAAAALLSASKNLSHREIHRKSAASNLPSPQKFDHLGRRIVPTISRLNSESEFSTRSQSPSLAGNNLTGSEGAFEKDEDMRRAKELVELFEKRENLMQMGTSRLGKSKARVDEVVQKYAQKHIDMKERAARARQAGVL